MNPWTVSNKPSALTAQHAAEIACQSIRSLTALVEELTDAVAELQAHRRKLAWQMDMADTRRARESQLSQWSHR